MFKKKPEPEADSRIATLQDLEVVCSLVQQANRVLGGVPIGDIDRGALMYTLSQACALAEKISGYHYRSR